MIEFRPIRVLQVAARYLPDLGGIESHINEVSRRLAREADLDVTVLATDRSGRLPLREDDPAGFRVLRRRAYPRERDYYFAPGVAGVIRDGGWDVVHFQGVHTLVPALGMPVAHRSRLPYVLTFHTGGSSSAVRSSARDLQWRLLAPSLRRARRLIAVSRFERDRFVAATGLPASRFDVIRNGGSLPAPSEPVATVAGRIVSSGRLERYKGHHRVIEALPAVRRQRADAHLVILGGGPYEAELRALAARLGVADHVAIYQVDPSDRSAMARELASAEVVAALSDYEAHPVAVMEALTLHRPVVGLDVAGIGDLVEEGLVTGLSTAADAEQTAATLAKAMTAGRRQEGVPAALPTWDTCAAQLAEVYRSVAGRRRSTPAVSRP